ncbi:hypothetical protein [Noviherbaspirillum humi]|uniref:hypothetical protein n=1 Tax=Noviherbaspirillum humi TaxID=1688639 RepID=UPI0011606384|nr:hypothetical protein [Noviherbaspirillum humi]
MNTRSLLRIGSRGMALAAVPLLLLGGCGRHSDLPGPGYTPRPTTSVARHVKTAQMDMAARPAPPAPGAM